MTRQRVYVEPIWISADEWYRSKLVVWALGVLGLIFFVVYSHFTDHSSWKSDCEQRGDDVWVSEKVDAKTGETVYQCVWDHPYRKKPEVLYTYDG